MGDDLRRSPSSRPATMLVIDGDTGLDQLLKKVIQEFDLGLTLCQVSTRDLDFTVLPSSPDIVLVNLAVSRVCLYLLPEMQQLWPDDVHLYAEAIQLGAYDYLPKPLEPNKGPWPPGPRVPTAGASAQGSRRSAFPG